MFAFALATKSHAERGKSWRGLGLVRIGRHHPRFARAHFFAGISILFSGGGYWTKFEITSSSIQMIECNLTLDAYLNFNISTTLYECCNSMDSEKRKQKFWGYGFRFSETEHFLKFGEILDSARRRNANSKCSVPSFIISYCVGSKGIHPRHPPREFPLGLRAPVLGSGTFSNGSNTSK